MKKNSFYIGVALLLLTLSISAQPVLNHLNDKAINTGLQGKTFDHYWSKCVSAGRANEGLRASWLEQLEMVHNTCGFDVINNFCCQSKK